MTAEPLAADLLRSVLIGLEQLFSQTELTGWRDRIQATSEAPDAVVAADMYRRLAGGSAPGTFHDLIVSRLNGHAITEQQEPWVNELLTTFQSLGLAAARAVADGGAAGRLPSGVEAAADRYAWLDSGGPLRSRILVRGLRCSTCGSQFVLEGAVESAAAARWSLVTAPAVIAERRSPDLVAAAFRPENDRAAQAALADVRPPIDALGLPTIARPYNRPGGAPDDRCPTCAAGTWKVIYWQLEGDPLDLQLLPLHDTRS